MKKIKALAIIPAKSDSKRLPGKNKKVIAGLTLVEHAIRYVENSAYVTDIILTSEDKETHEIGKKYNNNIISFGRDKSYMGEREVVDVYVNICNQINDIEEYTHIVGIQPDHPDRTKNIDDLLEYVVDNKYDDFFTINKDGTRNGSVRIFKAEHVSKGYISRRVGSQFDFATNIHNNDDLKKAEENINEQLHKKP